MTRRRVALLALAAFVVASDATLVAALLRQIAGTLSASPAAAGQAVTAYAAGYALGGPLITRVARRARQERLMAHGTAIACYGFGTWAVTPPQQHRLLSSGGEGRLLLSLNASALYAGVGLGGATGGLTLALSRSTAAVCWTAAGIELAALALAGRAASLDNGGRRRAQAPAGRPGGPPRLS